jgi:hypothetical protein
VAPGVSRREAKKARQKARKQARVSNLIVSMFRGAGALSGPVTVIVPPPPRVASCIPFGTKGAIRSAFERRQRA